MQKYHLRRKEKAISDSNELLSIIQNQQYFSIAICQENYPYLVSMNYAYEPIQNCFFFHCAVKGKKVDYLTANPKVWGQIVEDRGYIKGECEYNYRSVQFLGSCEFIENIEEKRTALRLMINRYEEDPEPVKTRLIKDKPLTEVLIGKIMVEEMTGKEHKVKNP